MQTTAYHEVAKGTKVDEEGSCLRDEPLHDGRQLSAAAAVLLAVAQPELQQPA